MFAADGSDRAALNQTRFTQPAIVALQLALLELWRHWGVEPAAVLGHSVGEISAAVAAGVFAPEDGLRLAAIRGRLMQELPPGGGMAAIFRAGRLGARRRGRSSRDARGRRIQRAG